ncbi:helix-turn-helix domain-containing protein [Flavobacterium sp.]|jgi:excisionase family DNA binding protein|uniref:helix-turn-helix transcriptional regulator n=1 Tax=Flavobacterium sp. TaxID=239 RepID=UPI00334287B2
MKQSKEEVLSLNEAAEFLKVSKSSIYKKTSQKQIPYYKPPGCKKIYFLKKDLEDWIFCNKINSVTEIGNQIESYLIKSQKALNYEN